MMPDLELFKERVERQPKTARIEELLRKLERDGFLEGQDLAEARRVAGIASRPMDYTPEDEPRVPRLDTSPPVAAERPPASTDLELRLMQLEATTTDLYAKLKALEARLDVAKE